MFTKCVSVLGLLLVSSITFASATTEKGCGSNAALARAGWKIHASSDFAKLDGKIQQILQTQASDFVLDMQSKMMSKASNRPVQITSWDHLSTSQELMFGDVLIILDLRSGTHSEVRWFDGTTKHIVYNSEFQSCAMDMVPFATNALF